MKTNIKSLFKNFINSGFEFSDDDMLIQLRYNILNISLVLGASGYPIEFIYNSASNNYILLYIETAVVLFLFFIIYRLRKLRSQYNQTTNLLTFFVLLFFDTLLILSNPEDMKYIWIVVFTAVFIFYKGNKDGWKWVAALSLSIILTKIQTILPISFGWDQLIYFMFLTFILTGLISYFQYTIESNYTIILTQKSMLTKFNQELEDMVQVKIHEGRIKDEILFQQAKMAAMGEMIGNIAHQWRQPLNTISVVSNRMTLQKELTQLDDKSYAEGMNTINDTVQYLSQTINDFKNYFRQDKHKEKFNIRTSLLDDIHLVEPSYSSIGIKIITSLNNCQIYSYKTELSQVILNIMSNAKDALENCSEEDKYIFISSQSTESKLTITIKDNAKGIDEEIILKIFEPYFTTKHQDQGTGIGLFMTEEIVVKHLEGTITVSNIDYNYEGNLYKGAKFDIILPLKQPEE